MGWACSVPDCGAVKEKGSWGGVGMFGSRLWPHSKGEEAEQELDGTIIIISHHS